MFNTSGCSWQLLIASGSFWQLLAGLCNSYQIPFMEIATGSLWQLLEAPDCFWQLLAAPGNSLQFLSNSFHGNCIWQLLAAPGSSWQLLAAPTAHFRLWQLLAALGCSWLLLASSWASFSSTVTHFQHLWQFLGIMFIDSYVFFNSSGTLYTLPAALGAHFHLGSKAVQIVGSNCRNQFDTASQGNIQGDNNRREAMRGALHL